MAKPVVKNCEELFEGRKWPSDDYFVAGGVLD